MHVRLSRCSVYKPRARADTCPQDGCTARLYDNRVAGNGAGSVQIDVGSVAVNVNEVASRNTLDTPSAAVTI